MYGHIKALAEAEKAGLAKAGIEADIFQVAETLPQEVLTKVCNSILSCSTLSYHFRLTSPYGLLTQVQMHAPPKSDYPVIDAAQLQEYDAFLFGIPTRYGNFPAQWKAFWDTTGGQWASGGYWGKFAGVFLSTGTPGGGQESTAISAMSTLAHHGSKCPLSPETYTFAPRTFSNSKPRSHLCPPRLQAHLPTTHQPLRSPRWLPMGRRNLRRR